MKVLFVFFVTVIACHVVAGRAPYFSEEIKRKVTFNRMSNFPDSFIVGGDPAFIEDFPHSLALIDHGWDGYRCGASVISRIWALTAAHCLTRHATPNRYNLLGGSTNRLTGMTTFYIQAFVMHPGFNINTVANDVAVMRADDSTPFEGVPNVRPIPISPICFSECCDTCRSGPDVTIAGWGIYDLVWQEWAENLLQVSKPVLDQDECIRSWNVQIFPSMFCLRVENGRDTCNGDSGSAAVRNGVQVGLVSFGLRNCGGGFRPSVYARIEDPVVRSFITEHTGI